MSKGNVPCKDSFPLARPICRDYRIICVVMGRRARVVKGGAHCPLLHYDDVIMSARASQITSLTIDDSTVYSDADERKYQSSASLAFVWGIHRWPVNSPHKGRVTRKIFPFDDVIMYNIYYTNTETNATEQMDYIPQRKWNINLM